MAKTAERDPDAVTATLSAVATPRSTQWLTFGEPDDPLLVEVGRISILHGHLDYVLRMTVKTLTDTTIRQALAATARASSSSLRSRIKKLAKAKLGDDEALVQLQALLERAKIATDKRNDLIHTLYAKDIEDGEVVQLDDDHTPKTLPTVDEIKKLGLEIKRVQAELNLARKAGLLAMALETRKG